MLGKIFGNEYFFHAQKAEDLVGNFNDHLQTCLLCFVDEVTFANDKIATNILKAIITEPTIIVNTKFKSKFVLSSFMNLFLAGNLARIVECQGNERRFVVLETNDKWSGSQTQQSEQYFQRLASTPPEMLRYFFSHRDISQFNPKKIPSSKAMRDQKSLSLSQVNSWLQRCLVRGRILDFVPANQLPRRSAGDVDVTKMTDAEQLAAEWEIPISKDHIYPAFSQYCKELGSKPICGDSIFWKGLHAVFRPHGSTDSRLIGPRPRVKPQVEGQTTEGNRGLQKQFINFPSLDESRQLFRDNVVHEATWSFEAQGETSNQDEDARYDDEQLGLKHVFV